MRKLVAYYSRTGNTKFVAEKIAEQLDADLCEVVDKKNRKRKANIFDWWICCYAKKTN